MSLSRLRPYVLPVAIKIGILLGTKEERRKNAMTLISLHFLTGGHFVGIFRSYSQTP